MNEPAEARRQHISRVAESFIAIAGTYKSPAVVFYKVLDRLQIALGEPIGIRLWSSKQPEARYQTTVLPKSPAESTPLSIGGALRLQLLSPRGSEGQRSLHQLVEIASSFVREVWEAVGAFEKAGGPSAFHDVMTEGLELAIRAQAGLDRGSIRSTVEFENSAQSNVLDEFLSGLSELLEDEDYRTSLPGQPSLPRFLVVYRYAPADGQSRIRLHLTDAQRSSLGAALSSFPLKPQRAAKDPPSLDRVILRGIERAIDEIDETFATGISRWIDWRRERSTIGDPAELRMLGYLVDGLDGGGRDAVKSRPPVLAIPIHVGGLPWLMLLGLFRPGESNRIFWSEAFYRDLLPNITTSIRHLAERSYLTQVGTRTRGGLGVADFSTDRLNQSLAELTSAFPYPEVALLDPPGPNQVTLSDNTYRICLLANRRLGRNSAEVEYRRLPAERICTTIDEADKLWRAERSERTEQRMFSYIAIGHTLKNVMEVAASSTAAGRVAGVRRDLPALDSGLVPKKAALRLRQAIETADRSLSLFAVAEGLGHFIRLAGASVGPFDWAKFREWLPSEPRRRVIGDELAAAYAAGIFEIGRSVCFGREWPSLRVKSTSTEALWNGKPPPPFSINSLYFPPFDVGAKVAFPIFFAVAEPLINAIEAVKHVPVAGCHRADVSPLEITVSTPDAEPEVVEVKFSNLSVEGLNKSISGFEATLGMLEDISLGQAQHQLHVDQLGRHLFQVDNTLRLTPYALARNILGAST